MINEETLNKLYTGVVNGNELTTKELNSYGFNSKDLSDLIKQGSLERVKRGYYSFQSVDDLFLYGKKLIEKKEYNEATECFKKCYELDSNHLDACFQLFLRCISKKNYESAFEYFEVLSDIDDPYYTSDTNFYLYLLSIITNIPEKHKEYARYLKFEDIRVDFYDERYDDILQQNKIRAAVLQRKFPYALKQFKDLNTHRDSLNVEDVITRTLLFQAVEAETISKNTILNLAKTKSYEKIAEYLEEKQNRHNLSLTESYTLKLVKEIINVQNTNQIPEKTIFESENLFDSIDGYNYELALNLSESYNNKNNINGTENTINLLLLDICNLIKQCTLSNKKTVNAMEDESVEISQEEIQYKESISPAPNLSTGSSFSDVIGFLMKNDLENAFRTLRNYMESINKKDYEFLIIDLIKLSLIEQDVAFTKPMIALTYVSRENFKFDISNYIQEFYVTLTQNRFDEARIYLDIISKSNKLGQSCILTDGLLQVLNNAEAMINKKINNPILDNVEEAFKKSQKAAQVPKQTIESAKKTNQAPQITFQKEPVSKTVIEKISMVSKVDKNITSVEDMETENKFLASKHELLLNNQGIILLKPMNSERIKKIHKMVKEYPDMVSFSIGEGENTQIVLRYKPFIDEFIDVKNLISAGNLAYNKGEYDSCIEAYLQLLQFGDPRAFVYARLGLAYMKKWDKDKAIDYLTIATELSKKENGQFDFAELIASLNGLISQDDKKPRFRMNVEDFGNDVENYYGIQNFDEITSYILESGLDVESACEQLGMTGEQINIIRLIYAREYYSQGNYEKGDQFLGTVEKSKNKTKIITKIFEETRRKKRFYINRTPEKTQKLVLTLQPRKNKADAK